MSCCIKLKFMALTTQNINSLCFRYALRTYPLLLLPSSLSLPSFLSLKCGDDSQGFKAGSALLSGLTPNKVKRGGGDSLLTSCFVLLTSCSLITRCSLISNCPLINPRYWLPSLCSLFSAIYLLTSCFMLTCWSMLTPSCFPAPCLVQTPYCLQKLSTPCWIPTP